jgi:hypothetical protein
VAGDWIKVEIATAQKPEVLHMAELLGVSRRECMGILVDFWAWLDANARHESVPNLSRRSLDSVLNCPGIAAALEVVGWVKWDDAGTTARIANFEHHNGQSAKARAYDQKRKRNERDTASEICPVETVTREEKRREEITPKSKPLVRVPLTEPSEEHHRIAEESGVPCLAEFVKYRDWLAASGKKHRDESAGFRNWLRNARSMKPPPGREPTLAEKRAANIAALTGQDKRERFAGVAERVGGAVISALPSPVREPDSDDVGRRSDGRGQERLG